MQTKDFTLNSFDLDLFSVIASHPTLDLAHAIQFADILGNLYINHLVYSRVIGAPFTQIVAAFTEQPSMQEYLCMFCRYALSLILKSEFFVRSSSKKSNLGQIEASRYQRRLLVDMLSWIIQQWSDPLNEYLVPMILRANSDFEKNTASDLPAAVSLLSLIGDAESILTDYKQSSQSGHPSNRSSSMQPVGGARAFLDIEKAKKLYHDKQVRAQR